MFNHFKSLFKYSPALLLILFVIYSPYKLIIVRGNSMFPTYKNNQLLIAKSINNYNEIKINDVLICQNEGNTIVKRVKYLQNQSIYYYFDSNSSEIKLIDKYTYLFLYKHPIASNKTLLQELIIPKNHIYLLGDNSECSDDSRRFGSISFNNILYKVVYPIKEEYNGKK